MVQIIEMKEAVAALKKNIAELMKKFQERNLHNQAKVIVSSVILQQLS